MKLLTALLQLHRHAVAGLIAGSGIVSGYHLCPAVTSTSSLCFSSPACHFQHHRFVFTSQLLGPYTIEGTAEASSRCTGETDPKFVTSELNGMFRGGAE